MNMFSALALMALGLLSTSGYSEAPAQAPPAVSVPSSVETFATLPFIEHPRISPNGQSFAGIFGIKGHQAIGIAPLFDKGQKPVFVGVPDMTEVDWVRWVNDDNIIAGLRAMSSVEGSNLYVSRAVAINRVSGKLTKLLWDSGGQNASNLIWVPQNGSNTVLIAAQDSVFTNYPGFYPTVYSVDVTNGHKQTVAGPIAGVFDWTADAAGNVRAGVGESSDGRNIRLLYRGEKGGLFKTMDRANTRLRQHVLHPVIFIPGTDHALAVEDDDNGRSAIYEYDLAALKRVRQVASDRDFDLDDLFVSDDHQILLGVRKADEGGTTIWLDAQMKALQDQFDKAVPGRTARMETLSADRKTMLVTVGAPDQPGGLYYYNVDAGVLQRVATLNENIGMRHLSPVKLVHYSARDGLSIAAILTLPKAHSTNLPMIVMPHGGPWAQDRLGYDYWAQFLASRGYAVLQPNFRGSTGYGTEFLRRGEGELGKAMQDDLTDGLRWAVDQKIADPKRVCIVGASYGGYAAMWGIIKDPDQYRCAISIAGVSLLDSQVNSFGRYYGAGAGQDEWKRMTPDFDAVSPANHVDRVKAPLLLIHGKKDVTVPYRQSTLMLSRMQAAGKKVEFVSLPLADHHYQRQADRLTLLNAMAAFLDKYNPADAAVSEKMAGTN